jgi:hypothetical protein
MAGVLLGDGERSERDAELDREVPHGRYGTHRWQIADPQPPAVPSCLAMAAAHELPMDGWGLAGHDEACGQWLSGR